MFLIPSQVLLRLIDDYLFITTSLTKAKNFLDMMKKGKYFVGFGLYFRRRLVRSSGIWVFHLAGQDIDKFRP